MSRRASRSYGRNPRTGLNAEPLQIGKLPVDLLRAMLARFAQNRDPRVVIGAGIGVNAAAIATGARSAGPRYLVAKTDPITFVSEEIGAYALTINANDLVTMGAVPRWFLATLLLPAGTTARRVARIFAQLHAACRRLNVALCGGHTEITDAVSRPVIAGCLLGECPKDRLIRPDGARVGDAVFLTKGIPIEAVSILARERADELTRRYSSRFVTRCRRYLTRPGISIVEDARLALTIRGVHAMHDPTEGGLSAALYEMAEAAAVGLRIEASAIRVFPEAARLCADLGLDPLGAIASGALLICADPSAEQRLMARFNKARIPLARIGTVVPMRHGVQLVEGRRLRPFPRFPVDEVARYLSTSRPSPN